MGEWEVQVTHFEHQMHELVFYQGNLLDQRSLILPILDRISKSLQIRRVFPRQAQATFLKIRYQMQQELQFLIRHFQTTTLILLQLLLGHQTLMMVDFLLEPLDFSFYFSEILEGLAGLHVVQLVA